MGARRGWIRLSVRLKISMRWVPPGPNPNKRDRMANFFFTQKFRQIAALQILVQMLLSTNTATRVVSSSNSWFVDRLC